MDLVLAEGDVDVERVVRILVDGRKLDSSFVLFRETEALSRQLLRELNRV